MVQAEGRAARQCAARTILCASVSQRVNHRDRCVHFNGLPIQDGWSITPLSDCVHCRLDKENITAQNLQRLDCSIRGYDGMQLDAAFLANLPGKRRKYRLDTMNQHRRLQVGDEDTLRRWRRRTDWWCWC